MDFAQTDKYAWSYGSIDDCLQHKILENRLFDSLFLGCLQHNAEPEIENAHMLISLPSVFWTVVIMVMQDALFDCTPPYDTVLTSVDFIKKIAHKRA